MNIGDFNTLDWFLIVMVGASTLFGFRAGLARVVIGFAAGIVGIVVGFWFYQVPAAWFSRYFQSATVASALGFLVVFGGVVLVGGIFARLLAAVFKWAGLTWLDRLLGAGAGFLRGMLVALGIVIPLLAFAPDPAPKYLEESQLTPYTVAFGRVLVEAAPAKVREQFEKTTGILKFLWKGELKKVLPQIGKPEDEPKPAPRQKPTHLKKESY